MIVDSTLTQDAASKGGAVAAQGGTLEIDGTTIDNNAATHGSSPAGGGIYISGLNGAPVDVLLRDSIVAANGLGVLRAGQFHIIAPDDVEGALDPAGAYNLIGDGAGMMGIGTGQGGNLVGSAASPLNPLLSPLANNGGPTQTQALLPGSPALDRGGPDPLADPLTWTDQRGLARINRLPVILEPAGGDGRDIGGLRARGQARRHDLDRQQYGRP